MFEILVDNKNGTVWDISEIVSSVTWRTSRIGKAGSLDLTFIKGAIYQDPSFSINNGDIIRVRKDEAKVFYGYVFEGGSRKDEDSKIKAYDQLRYLMSNDTYVFSNVTATQVIQRIADDFGLKVGNLVDTGYRIPSMVEDNKKLLDIIYKALDLTLMATGQIYVLYDDFGALTLRNAKDWVVDISVGDESLLFDYDFKRSIDNETYNRIKIVQDNKETGRRDVYIAQDSASIAKWGRLQYFQKADNLNEAQINEQLNALLELKNREQKSLRIDAIGDIRIRAGCFVPITIQELGIDQLFLVDECTHKFEGDNHTMTLELKVI